MATTTWVRATCCLFFLRLVEHASIPFSHDESIDPNLCLALLPFACLTAQTTFYVNMECAPSFDEVFVTGPWCGWCGNYGDNALYDEDGDGIYNVPSRDLKIWLNTSTPLMDSQTRSGLWTTSTRGRL